MEEHDDLRGEVLQLNAQLVHKGAELEAHKMASKNREDTEERLETIEKLVIGKLEEVGNKMEN